MNEFDPRHAGNLSSPRWMRLLLRFNLQPALYADPIWLPKWAMSREMLKPSVLDALSLAMLRENGLENHKDWAMTDRAGRFFLMDSRSLRAVAVALGVASQRDSLRRVVLNKQLDALRSALGDALGTLWMPVAELVEHAQRPVSIAWDAFDAQALQRALAIDGYQQLLRLVDRGNHAVWGRAVLCAPHGVACHEQLGTVQAKRLTDGVIFELIPRRAAKWDWLF